ncbi:hypothetical protein HAP90_00280 [Klebsiella quasipneumoniae subsp. similipneumoniae]|uniref:hypothetical protein n=1 Tax=Klebsiella quasipneumoniae TaxID=1463165 RepID=UPI0013FDB317|nr:hypothetical protein [Klebsiella quasipneumoniae]NHJ27355.1 hypothetical protein [Klebsiella quasipneumoniae subsp. similipneumoniae]NHJ50073.1 hypothetical protein [Klebsiella quasipneumoniae subsp. similipneumoniae]NHJ64861.1 hypothetical protein [Klebsiella quasipneumoniae subsp. similipneumoniae]NHJ73355.1 hypothetical protein [Klebsiella quasipneumoniae subsp. similipneumoniae]NHJ80041.1 hypothetical protein [Klebsiella quasipneumoniae subsp. similipneumoniae]
MWKIKHLLMNAAQGAEAPAGSTGGNDGGNGDGTQNPGGGTPAGTSLLSTGAGEQGADDWLPEKYRVMGDDGKLNVEGSARKLADAYSHLEKRMGSGDTPPKTADDYAPEVKAEGFNWDEFKADPRMQSFMKSAHAKGITNDQMGFIISEYAQIAPELVNGAGALDSEAAATQLRETWKTDAEFNKNIGLAFRAFNSLADDSDKGRMDEIGNNPMVIRMLAKIGAEMQEDSPTGADSNPGEQQTIRDLMKSPAYMDPKHADHERVSAQVKAYYQKRYGDQTVA